MGLAWDRSYAHDRAAALINRGPWFRKPRTGSFESLLHRHIRNDKTPENVKVFRGFVFSGGEKGPYGNVRGNTVCWIARVQILVDGAALLSFPLLAIAIFLPDSLMLVSGWMITALGWIFYECLSRCKRVAAG